MEAIKTNSEFICNEVLANEILFGGVGGEALVTDIEVEGDTKVVLVRV